MKKVLLPIMVLIVIFHSAAAFSKTSADKLTPSAPGAHMWDMFDEAFKRLLIGGLLVGYRQGVAVGAASEHRRLKSDTEMSRVEADRLAGRAQGLFDKPVMYYVGQADQFIQKYPVCKNMQLTRLLDQLVLVWAAKPLQKGMGYDFIQKTTYKDIGKACLETPN